MRRFLRDARLSCIRHWLCVLSVWGLASAAHAGDAAFEFSACIHLALGRSDAFAVASALERGGLSGFRDDVYWDAIEQADGSLVFPAHFEQLVVAARAVRARGGRPLIILSYGSRHHDNGGLVVSEAGRTAFERYARFVVRRFGNLVDRYEVWNEWNAGFGSNPRQNKGDAVAYVRLLERTASAIRQENPRARVVGGAVAGADFGWIRRFIAAGGLDHLDAFSLHSYTLFKFLDNPEAAIRALDEVHELLHKSRPDREIPILVTEMGWPTHTGRYGVSESLAARYLVRFTLLARTRPWIGGVWWYDLFDDGDNPTSMEHRFGLLRRNGDAKPAFDAATRIAPLVRSEVSPRAYRTNNGVYIVAGRDERAEWAVAWRVEPAVLSWIYGSVDAPEPPADLLALADPDGPIGEPTFWHKEASRWTRGAPLQATR